MTMGSAQWSRYASAPVGEAPDPQHRSSPSHHWKAQFLRRLPAVAICAIFVAVGCMVFMVLIVMKSNGDLIENWAISPGVYLAIASVLANIVLRYTFSKGVEISWWVTAMKEGTTVKDLHNIWSYGMSLQASLLAGRNFNYVALTAILLALVPVNAPLAQRASRALTRSIVSDVNIQIKAIKALLDFDMATGQITGRSHQPTDVSATFASVLQRYLISEPIQIANSTCRGTCRGALQAAGYEMICVNGTEFFDKTPRSVGELGEDGSSPYNATAVFSTVFSYSEFVGQFSERQPIMNLTTKYKDHGECKGRLIVRNCTLVPATLEYRVVMTNGSIALDGGYTYEDDKVVKYVETPTNGGQGATVHGGMWLVLSRMFDSMVTLRFAGAVGMDTTTDGITSLRYARHAESPNETTFTEQCQSYWVDPADDILTTARDLIFRFAVQGNLTGVEAQSIQMSQQDAEVVYSSDFLFLGLALLLIGLPAISTVPLLLHWWRLGRTVSLSPIEVARAFAAPELAGSGSNSDANELMREVGSKEIRYGAVNYGQNGIVMATGLAFANPTVVQRPQNEVSY
ncbi:Fc.00g054810.m01.CDS01 [Cosmosporella sp. VM-42]